MPRAVILAGGKGTRLLPYTIVVPKPMLPIGGIPIIEVIARQLKFFGFDQVTISLGHLSGMVEHFLAGMPKSPELPHFTYFQESNPLGTTGPIKAISPSEENFLVINGDILTTLNMKEMYESHVSSGALLTIGIRKTTHTLAVGSITVDQLGNVTKFEEKPEISHLDNIGAYVYSSKALNFIEDNEKIDVNTFTQRLLDAGQKVLGFRSDGPYYWVDIGTHADYEKANLEFEELRVNFPFLKGL
jgi:NDP-sugar pyrophosphorylase family protein